MTAQQAPHTPLWRRFLSLPHTRLGRWAIGLTVGAALLLSFGLFLNAFVDVSPSSPWVGSVFVAGLLAGVAGTVVASIALLRGPERSALVWLAMVAGLPALLPLGWIVLVLGGGLGGIPTLLVMIALAVLIGVLIAWLRRHRSGSREL